MPVPIKIQNYDLKSHGISAAQTFKDYSFFLPFADFFLERGPRAPKNCPARQLSFFSDKVVPDC